MLRRLCSPSLRINPALVFGLEKRLCHTIKNISTEKIPINFKLKDGSLKLCMATEGIDLMHLAHENEIELEGACEGVCACSTCHVILQENLFNDLPEASDDENDMLDQAPGLTPYSRLGCQIKVTASMRNMIVTLPTFTRNFYVDGFVPKPH